MIRRAHVGLAGLAALVVWALAGCGGMDPPPPPPPPAECTDSVAVTVTIVDTVPHISWTPDCLIGRLLIEEGIDEYWGTETCGTNSYRSPMIYDVNPPGTCPEEGARPLEHGHTYQIRLFRWISYNPPAESLQVVGVKHFTY